MNVIIIGMDRDYEEVKISVPSKYEVCPRCGGEGHHSNPSIDGNGFSDEIRDDDPEFYEDYMAGRYDVRCTVCNGERVVSVPDTSACTYAEKRMIVRKKQYDYQGYLDKQYQKAEMRAMGYEG